MEKIYEMKKKELIEKNKIFLFIMLLKIIILFIFCIIINKRGALIKKKELE
jgi:hypothetical protein